MISRHRSIHRHRGIDGGGERRGRAVAPLLIKGEPGTGKTLLANEIARALDQAVFEWHIKSHHQGAARVVRIRRGVAPRDSQLGDPRVKDIRNYILKGNLWEAFDCDVQPVLLIDEIDKADIEFPNDLLRELDAWNSTCTRPAKRCAPSIGR